MKALLELLQDGRAWSIEELALRLHTTADDIKRQMAFLEHAGFFASCGKLRQSTLPRMFVLLQWGERIGGRTNFLGAGEKVIMACF